MATHDGKTAPSFDAFFFAVLRRSATQAAHQFLLSDRRLRAHLSDRFCNVTNAFPRRWVAQANAPLAACSIRVWAQAGASAWIVWPNWGTRG